MARNNVVAHCRIFGGGEVHPAAIGVWIGQSPGNQILHNDIHDLYYTGVSVGWTWGYGPARAQGTRVAYNRIYNIGRGLLSDMGGIYTLGDQRGSVLSHNLIHDVRSFDYGGWGIYPDEGTTGLVVRDNVVYGCKAAGFHQHYGKDNVIENNVFALNTEAQLARDARRGPPLVHLRPQHRLLDAGRPAARQLGRRAYRNGRQSLLARGRPDQHEHAARLAEERA